MSPPAPVSPGGLTPRLGVPQQPVDAGRGAAGGDGAGRALPGNLDRGAEQIHLLPVRAVDVILEGTAGVTPGPPTPWGPQGDGDTHVDAGVVEEEAVAGQGHVFLLPLLVQGVAAALQQEALGTGDSEGTEGALGATRVLVPPPPPTCLMGMARPLPAASPRLSRLRFSESLPRRVCGDRDTRWHLRHSWGHWGAHVSPTAGARGAADPTTVAPRWGHPECSHVPQCHHHQAKGTTEMPPQCHHPARGHLRCHVSPAATTLPR